MLRLGNRCPPHRRRLQLGLNQLIVSHCFKCMTDNPDCRAAIITAYHEAGQIQPHGGSVIGTNRPVHRQFRGTALWTGPAIGEQNTLAADVDRLPRTRYDTFSSKINGKAEMPADRESFSGAPILPETRRRISITRIGRVPMVRRTSHDGHIQLMFDHT